MSEITAILCVYGKPSPNTIIKKEAAIHTAQKAKEQGKILDYYVVAESETTGKIIAIMEIGNDQHI